MAFSDPTSLSLGATVTPSGGTATSMASVDRAEPYTGKYSTSDGLTTLKISHRLGARTRSEFRCDLFTTYTDPATGLTSTVSAAGYFSLNRPIAGFSNAQLKSIISGVCAFIGVSANQDKFLGLES
jgi:hypothetical protein